MLLTTEIISSVKVKRKAQIDINSYMLFEL